MPQIGIDMKVYQVLCILFLLGITFLNAYVGIVILAGFAFALLERLSRTESKVKSLEERLTTLESRTQAESG